MKKLPRKNHCGSKSFLVKREKVWPQDGEISELTRSRRTKEKEMGKNNQ